MAWLVVVAVTSTAMAWRRLGESSVMNTMAPGTTKPGDDGVRKAVSFRRVLVAKLKPSVDGAVATEGKS